MVKIKNRKKYISNIFLKENVCFFTTYLHKLRKKIFSKTLKVFEIIIVMRKWLCGY